jgi:phosphatidylinositol phospholipase C delta
VDCWNGDEGPVIYHGKTLTSSVSVRDVCTAVKRYGFMASPYPIIISAEVHCSLEQQVQLVKTLKEVFGDALITRASPLIDSKDALPSPTQLMHKILFKVRLFRLIRYFEHLADL